MYINEEWVHNFITEHEAIGPAFKDPQGRSGLWKTAYSELPEIMKEGSYLFYEFKDIEKEYNIDDEHPEYGTYLKYISPLFTPSITNDMDNQDLINIIDDELPYYHAAFDDTVTDESKDIIASTRDLGINDIPSYMQTEFWFHWLRDVQGYIQNYVLLDVFNKLRYPFVNENQYLNASLFPELAQKAYNPSNDGGEGVSWDFIVHLNKATVGEKWKINDTTGAPQSFIDKIKVGDFIRCEQSFETPISPEQWDNYWELHKQGSSIIQFKTTAEDNAEDLTNPNFVGCLDYLNDVVNKKLSSTYAMIDYNPDPSNLLSDWSESLYESGKATSDEVEKEKVIFRLQDINYELLKRKFAGSSTLYSLALTSIDRSGSFASIIRVGDLATASATFKDKRFIRILNIPGILAKYPNIKDLDPIDTYYQIPLDDGETEIPLGVVTPLFYTSATTSKGPYDSGAFYNGENLSTSLKDYRAAYLRDNISVIDWNNPTGISSSSSINMIYKGMDEITGTDPTTHLPIYTKMDEMYDPGEGTPYPRRLDISTPSYRASSIIGNILDITSNRLLYHRNTLQKEMGALYPYLTYPIASDNSVSLMDLSWISYLKDSTSKKSRVQDDVAFGEQISRYTIVPAKQTAEYQFFGISYGDNDTDHSYKYGLDHFASRPKFAFLWYYEVQYNKEDFAITSIKDTLISKIALTATPNPQFENIEAYKEMETRNVGILPFTYKDMKGETLASMRLGLYTDDGVERFFDDISDFGYAKAYYVFSEYDMLVKNSFASGEPEGASEDYFTLNPSEETKSVFYIIKKDDDSYVWSESIKTIPLNENFDVALLASTMIPDWKGLGYHLNPYLNFTANSASAIRHKSVIPAFLDSLTMSPETQAQVCVGPSEHCGLSNLARSRHMDFVCNDEGERAPTKWVTGWETKYSNPVAKTVAGMYLDRTRPTNPVGYDVTIPEWAIVKGDNRFADVYDEVPRGTDPSYTPVREVVYTGSLQVPSINITKGTATNTGANNFFTIVPKAGPDASTSDYQAWYWNKASNGITICANIKLDNTNINNLVYLVHRNQEFSLDILPSGNGVDFRFTYAGQAVTIHYTGTLAELSKRNYRITAAATAARLTLCVNNRVTTATGTYTITKPSGIVPIYVGSFGESRGYEFFGDIFDLRLYNCGHSKEQCQLLNAGLIREQYSYAPSIYKLGYSIYNDLGVFKTHTHRPSDEGVPSAASLPTIKSVRVFNRSVWDSVLVDMYPISEEERTNTEPQYINCWYDPTDDTDVYDDTGTSPALKDCVELLLQEGSEVYNGTNPMTSTEGTCKLRYDGKVIDIDQSDMVTILNTSVYPVNYDKANFVSGAVLEYNATTQSAYTSEHHISIPVSPTAGTLKYAADMSLNFTVAPQFDLSNWYSRGNNIALNYNARLNRPVATLTNHNVRNSNNNHILIPLRLPKQPNLTENDKGYLDRIILRGIELNGGMTTFLRATSYYNELRVPVAKQARLTELPSYTSKWDAIRCLKEGSYYFTCKYPVQILPYMDYLYNTSANSGYTTVYATARFKIEVKGSPIQYDPSKYAISGYPKKYLSDNIQNTLTSSNGLIVDVDNRTFPHRLVNIDLYVQDVSGIAGKMSEVTPGTEDYTFEWKLIGSNHPTDFTGFTGITLNKDTLDKALVITADIPLFFSKNYSSPMFIAKSKKIPGGEEYDSTSADDDFIDPYDVKTVYNKTSLAAEKLTANVESDMDDQHLVSGRAYKMLMDYSGRMSEISFADKTFTPVSGWSGSYPMTDAEKKNFARLVSLLDTTTASTIDYMYSGNSNWSATKDINVKGKTSGFHINNTNTWDTAGASGVNYYFGNPYSRASSTNYILNTNKGDRTNVDNSMTFAYLPENVPSNTYQSAAYINQLDTIATKQNSTVYTIKTIALSEADAIETQWQRINGTINSALNALKSDASGMFTSLSKIVPNLVYGGTTTANTVDYVSTGAYNLYGYYAAGRSVASKNGNITITRRGLYSNNLITNQNFDDNTSWSSNVNGVYVADTTWDEGKDVYQITATTAATPAIFKYNAGSKIVGAKYEAAISIYSLNTDNIEAKAQYIVSNGSSETITATVTLLPTTPANGTGWYIFEAETDSIVNADKVAFTIRTKTTNETIKFTKAVIRKSESTSHFLGLSDALYATLTASDTSRVSLADHRAIIYKDVKTGEVVPVQLNNISKERNITVTDIVSYAESGQNRVSDFINSHSLGFETNNSRIERLFEPWVRRLYYWQKYTSRGQQPVANKVAFYKYNVGVDASGIKTRQIVANPIEDVFTTTGTVIAYVYNGSHIEVTSLKFNTDANAEYKDSNLNLNTSAPITLVEEKFTCLTNCFNPTRYQEKLSSPIAITNIQLMSETGTGVGAQRLYEIEYLPLIYDERDQHFSLNLFLHRH